MDLVHFDDPRKFESTLTVRAYHASRISWLRVSLCNSIVEQNSITKIVESRSRRWMQIVHVACPRNVDHTCEDVSDPSLIGSSRLRDTCE